MTVEILAGSEGVTRGNRYLLLLLTVATLALAEMYCTFLRTEYDWAWANGMSGAKWRLQAGKLDVAAAPTNASDADRNSWLVEHRRTNQTLLLMALAMLIEEAAPPLREDMEA